MVKLYVKFCCAGDLFLKILMKEHSFLRQRLFSRDSKPNSWYSFPFEVPRVAPVIVRQAYVSFLISKEMMYCRLGHTNVPII